MKIIDLLNKISNGEVPEHIRYNDMYMTYDKQKENYYDSFGAEIDWKYTVMEYINDEIEIIEDTPKEEKKIPEKLKSLNNVGNSKDLVEFEDKQQLNNHLLKDKLNEVIHYLQYLKTKGE